jgi:surface protein
VFAGAGTFNQDISSWDVGRVTSMNQSECVSSLHLFSPRLESVPLLLTSLSLSFSPLSYSRSVLLCRSLQPDALRTSLGN